MLIIVCHVAYSYYLYYKIKLRYTLILITFLNCFNPFRLLCFAICNNVQNVLMIYHLYMEETFSTLLWREGIKIKTVMFQYKQVDAQLFRKPPIGRRFSKERSQGRPEKGLSRGGGNFICRQKLNFC
jgi:hypothetical protein